MLGYLYLSLIVTPAVTFCEYEDFIILFCYSGVEDRVQTVAKGDVFFEVLSIFMLKVFLITIL